jgi:hypothetical protein
MVEGASCPACHIATVTEVGEIPSGPGDVAPEAMLVMFPHLIERQVIATEQIARLLTTRRALTAEALRDAFKGAPVAHGKDEWLATCNFVVQVLRERGY